MKLFSNPTKDEIKMAAQALKDGHLVAFPTETVYGLGADATNERAVSRIYLVKARPVAHPLIVHISSINKLGDWATYIPDYAIKLAREFWPGPMTLILPRKDIAKDFVTGGQNNVGLRVPDQPIALAMLREFDALGGKGIAAPSANRFGAVSPTTAQAVEMELGDYFGKNDLVLNGGACQIGVESTIVDCRSIEPRVLRPGAVTYAMIESLLGKIAAPAQEIVVTRVPGMLKNHYSPKAKVVINSKPKAGEGLIALSSIPTPSGAIRLGAIDTVEDFARNIYELLRLGDSKGILKIAVVLPTTGDLADAIKDRMTKAAGG
jgi:L-threonylcarbamoyladenylate synthase